MNSKIKSIKPLGKKPTFDIEVNSKEHIFYGNDIATSNSHAYAYGLTGYQTAYIKAHFPVAFYWSWLIHEVDKVEKGMLIEDAKYFNVKVKTPNIIRKNPDFASFGNEIYFGLGNIKGLGEAQLKKTLSVLNDQIDIFSWHVFLIVISPKLTKTVVNNLIQSGALDELSGLTRHKMLHEYSVFDSLTDLEQKGLLDNITKANGLLPLLKLVGTTKKEGGIASNVKRVEHIRSCIQILQNPPTSMLDSPIWLSNIEEELLGVGITASKVEAFDLTDVNCTVAEFIAGKTGNLLLGVEITDVYKTKTKKGDNPGQEMAFLKFKDGTGSFENAVIFPEAYAQYKDVLYIGSFVGINGGRSPKNKSSLIVNKVWYLNR